MKRTLMLLTLLAVGSVSTAALADEYVDQYGNTIYQHYPSEAPAYTPAPVYRAPAPVYSAPAPAPVYSAPAPAVVYQPAPAVVYAAPAVVPYGYYGRPYYAPVYYRGWGWRGGWGWHHRHW